MEKKYKFWVKEVDDWSQADINGYKYEYSIIQNKKDGCEDTIADNLINKLIAHVYWNQYSDGDEFELSKQELEELDNSGVIDEASLNAIKNSHFSVSY